MVKNSNDSKKKVKSSPDEKFSSFSEKEITGKILFKKSMSFVNNSSTRLPNDLAQTTRSVDLQDMLLRLSHSSDFHMMKSEDIPQHYTPNNFSIYKGDNSEKEFLIFDKRQKNIQQIKIKGYFEMISPYKYELAVCLLSYVSLLLYSLIKGGKGFKR